MYNTAYCNERATSTVLCKVLIFTSCMKLSKGERLAELFGIIGQDACSILAESWIQSVEGVLPKHSGVFHIFHGSSGHSSWCRYARLLLIHLFKPLVRFFIQLFSNRSIQVWVPAQHRDYFEGFPGAHHRNTILFWILFDYVLLLLKQL